MSIPPTHDHRHSTTTKQVLLSFFISGISIFVVLLNEPSGDVGLFNFCLGRKLSAVRSIMKLFKGTDVETLFEATVTECYHSIPILYA